jgi:hypothetical protein
MLEDGRSTVVKRERLEREKEVKDGRGKPEGEDGFGGGYQEARGCGGRRMILGCEK